MRLRISASMSARPLRGLVHVASPAGADPFLGRILFAQPKRQSFLSRISPLMSSPNASTPITTLSIPCARTLPRATKAWASPAKRAARCSCASRERCAGTTPSLQGKLFLLDGKYGLVLFPGRCSGPAPRRIPIGRSALAASFSARPYPARARSRESDAREHPGRF